MKKIIFFLIFLISFSCKYNEVPKPEKMLSEQQMEDIMYDLAILNAAKSSDIRVLEENNIIPTQFLYKRHKIDSLQLAQNSIYYAAQPEKYKRIIDRVGTRLKEEREIIVKEDSINNKKELTPGEELEKIEVLE